MLTRPQPWVLDGSCLQTDSLQLSFPAPSALEAWALEPTSFFRSRHSSFGSLLKPHCTSLSIIPALVAMLRFLAGVLRCLSALPVVLP